MLYKTMQLLFKALERRIIISNKIHWWYESEWYHILYSWWIYKIKKWDYFVELSKDTHHLSKDYKEFKKWLKEFLSVTFPD